MQSAILYLGLPLWDVSISSLRESNLYMHHRVQSKLQYQ